jgi:hypothetical protein
MALAPVAIPGNTATGTAAVTIVIGGREDAVTTRTPQSIELQVSVFTPDGIAVGRPQRQTAPLTLLPGNGETRYELVTQVPIKQPGRYTMRVAVHRATDGRHGSVYGDVEVPDFAKAPLSMSGVWLETAPGVLAVRSEGLSALIPFVPTSSRTFARSGRLNASFRVYQGGSDPLAPCRARRAHHQRSQCRSGKQHRFDRCRTLRRRLTRPQVTASICRSTCSSPDGIC